MRGRLGLLVLTCALAGAAALPAGALATFPGANGEIAFTDLRDEQEIKTIEPRGGPPRSLTSGAEPAWAASGRTLLYAYFFPQDEQFAVAGLTRGSQDPPTFLTDPALEPREEDPAPAPDGRRFAYVQDADLRIADVPRGDGYPASRRVGTGRCPDWSPDGSSIAYSFGTLGGEFIGRVTPDGRRLKAVFRSSRSLSCPSWSPDGRRLAFFSQSRNRILIVTPGGRVTRRIRVPLAPLLDSEGRTRYAPVDSLAVAFSPDGRSLAYARNDLGLRIVRLRDGATRRICRCADDLTWRPVPAAP